MCILCILVNSDHLSHDKQGLSECCLSSSLDKNLQRAVGSGQNNRNNKEYDRLLAEAVKLGKQHETKAKYFVPKMYDALVKEEGLVLSDAADRIYKDLVGIWQKDTIRRLLPPDAKNQIARDMQALSRFPLESKAGSILHERKDKEAAAAANNHEDSYSSGGNKMVALLEEENARLRKTVEELASVKKSLVERTLRLERLLAEQREQNQHKQDSPVNKEGEVAATTTIVLPPHLFMKTFTLMRGSTKPLVLKVKAREAVDVDRIKM